MATGRLPDPNTAPLTAKGDLYTYSTVPARLAVGSNGDTLVADSSTTTGLRYNPPVGSLAQPIINGGFDVWQRGTSVAISASTNGYTADRWTARASASNATTVSRQSVNDTTNLPNIQFCARVQRNSGQTGTGAIDFFHNLETANSIPFAGRTVTMTFYARAGANFSAASSGLGVAVYSGTGTDQNVYTAYTGITTLAAPTVTLTTTWQRFATTFTVGSTATELSIGFFYSGVGTAGANDWYEITGVQFDVGTWTASTAPTFRRSGGTLAGELSACQRYYFRYNAPQNNTVFGSGMNTSTTTGAFYVKFPQTMRTHPTSVEGSTLQISDFDAYGTDITTVAIVSNGSGTDTALIIGSGGSGFTDNQPSFLRGKTANTSYIGFSAEL